jgi:hypothetical protein
MSFLHGQQIVWTDCHSLGPRREPSSAKRVLVWTIDRDAGSRIVNLMPKRE